MSNNKRDFWAEWHTPPTNYRPFVRWWWPGMDVSPSELRRELDELEQQGFGGAEIQAFCFGLPGEEKQHRAEFIHRFAPNPFYSSIIKYVLSEAAKRNLTIDLTIGSSWPPGNTTITLGDSLQTLLLGTTIITGKNNEEISIPLPPMQIPPYYKYQNLMRNLMGPILERFDPKDFTPILTVAIRPIKSSPKLHFVKPRKTPLEFSSAINLTELVGSDKILRWNAPQGKWQIFTLYQGPSGMCPMLDARSEPKKQSLVVDLFNESRIRDYLKSHLQQLLDDKDVHPFLGSTLRALFTDSQEIASEWFFTEDFFTEFERRRGYDVRPYIPACFVPNRDNQFLEVFFQGEKPCFDFPNGVGERIRHDWWHTLSDLWAERYCGGVSRWGQPYGIKHRIQPYGIYTDLLKAFGAADIPETEQLFAGGLMDFLKLAGSAGVIYQKRIVSCESLVWQFRDHITTPFKWKVAADRLFVAGINQMIYHGLPYTPDPNENAYFKFPGYDTWPNHGTNMNRANPFWPFYRQMNDYVARGQYLMQQGITQCKIAVYYPLYNYDFKFLHDEDLRGGYLEGYDIPPSGGILLWYLKRAKSRRDRLTRDYHRLGAALTASGFYYVHINDEVLLRSPIRDSKLIAGDAQIQCIIFPNVAHISLEVAQCLEKCVANGVHVLFIGEKPYSQPGFFQYETYDPLISGIVTQISAKTANQQLTIQNIGEYLKNSALVPPDITLTDTRSRLQFIHKVISNGNSQDHIYFLRNSSAQPLHESIGFPEGNLHCYHMDLWSGKIIPKSPDDSKSTKFTLIFGPYDAKMLYFTEKTLKDLDLNYSQNFDLFSLLETNKTEIFPVQFTSWYLQVPHRLVTGEYEIIELTTDTLFDWRDHPELRYCSGPGLYRTKFHVDSQLLKNAGDLFLDLGKVHDVAVVTLNGNKFDPLLVPPYVLSLSNYLQMGGNLLEIEITGTLRNTLVGYGKIGDTRYGGQKKKPLMPVGLLGPIQIRKIKNP
jgi:hypothetical protein